MILWSYTLSELKKIQNKFKVKEAKLVEEEKEDISIFDVEIVYITWYTEVLDNNMPVDMLYNHREIKGSFKFDNKIDLNKQYTLKCDPINIDVKLYYEPSNRILFCVV